MFSCVSVVLALLRVFSEQLPATETIADIQERLLADCST